MRSASVSGGTFGVEPSQRYETAVNPHFVHEELITVSSKPTEQPRPACLLIVILCLMGCGSGGRLPTSPVSGTVSVGDKPIAGADVTFHPADDKQKIRPAFGKTNDAGEFELSTYDDGDGAVPGEYKISIVKQSLRPGIDVKTLTPSGQGTGGSAGMDMYKKMTLGNKREKATVSDASVPAKYSDREKSGLKRTVEASGGNVFNLKLDASGA